MLLAEPDALLLDEEARTDTYPYIEIEEKDASVGHEATVSKINDDQILYLQSRGLSEDEAAALLAPLPLTPAARGLAFGQITRCFDKTPIVGLPCTGKGRRHDLQVLVRNQRFDGFCANADFRARDSGSAANRAGRAELFASEYGQHHVPCGGFLPL